MSIPTGVLVRISDDRRNDERGVTDQEADCRALADRHDGEVVRVYRENDTSAFKRRKVRLPDGTTAMRVVRPEFRAMLEDLVAGRIRQLVAYNLDRVARDPRDLEDLIDAVEASGIPARAVTGNLDLSSDAGITMARVQVAIANQSSRDTSRRVSRAMLSLAESGGVHGGARPFGYDEDKVSIRADEAEAVRWAHQQVATGRSLRSLGIELAGRFPDRRWDVDGVRRVLISPRYAGLRQHRGAVIGQASWPAIVPADVWEQTRALLADRQHPNRQVGGARRYLLTGLLICGRCATPQRLYPRRNADRQRFGCLPTASGGCGGCLVVYDPAEEHIIDLVLRRLQRDADLQQDAPDDPTGPIRQEIARVERQQQELGEQLGDDPGELVMARAANRRLSERLDTLRRQLAAAAQVRRVADPQAVLDGWPDYDPDQQRAVLDVLIDRIVVAPASRGGPRFDPTRLAVDWR